MTAVCLIKRPLRLAVVLLALAAAPLFAHDLWIEPSTFSPRPGEAITLRLRVGEHLTGEALPYLGGRVQRFDVHDAAAARPVNARNGMEPAGALRAATPGLAIVDYRSHPSRVELDAAKFDAYLREEGLDSVLASRAGHAASDGKVRELFARCAKALLWVGESDAGRNDRPLGCPLELAAERNPYRLTAEQRLPFRLTYQGVPLAGALVVALNSRDPAERQTTRSDSDGRVTFQVRPGGLWLVKAVHMVSAPPGSDADWLSWWASLTFGTGSLAQ